MNQIELIHPKDKTNVVDDFKDLQRNGHTSNECCYVT